MTQVLDTLNGKTISVDTSADGKTVTLMASDGVTTSAFWTATGMGAVSIQFLEQKGGYDLFVLKDVAGGNDTFELLQTDGVSPSAYFLTNFSAYSYAHGEVSVFTTVNGLDLINFNTSSYVDTFYSVDVSAHTAAYAGLLFVGSGHAQVLAEDGGYVLIGSSDTSMTSVVQTNGIDSFNQTGRTLDLSPRVVTLGDGNDVLTTGAAPHTVHGGGGDDLLTGGENGDALYGEGGNDTLYGEIGNDNLYGGDGNDVLHDYFNYGNDMHGGTGDDTIVGTGNMYGEDGNDFLSANGDWALSDETWARWGNSWLDGGVGNDTLQGDTFAANTLIGGAGDDTYYVYRTDDKIMENSGGGHDRIYTTVSGVIIAPQVEDIYAVLTGATHSFKLAGNGLGNLIEGNIGNDTLKGMDGNDTLHGDGGKDSLDGGSGDDSVTGDGILIGGIGNDTLVGGHDNDTLYGGTGTNSVDGGDGDDTAVFSGQRADYTIAANGDATGFVVTLKAGGEKTTVFNVEHLQFADTTIVPPLNAAPVSSGAQTMLAHGLQDHAYVVTAAQLLAGYSDPDGDALMVTALVADHGTVTDNHDGTYTVTPEPSFAGGLNLNYFVTDGHGGTLAVGEAVSFDIFNHNQTGSSKTNDHLVGSLADDSLNGAGGDDTLEGGPGNDTLQGGVGNDVMRGGAGDDTYYVDSTSDAISEIADSGGDAGGNDRVYASVSIILSDFVENLTLTGSANINGTGNDLQNNLYGNGADNLLSGLGGNDKIKGGAGNDTLIGGSGNDWLEGGAGADKFVFSAAAANGRDSIQDFEHGIDKLVFAKTDYSASAHFTQGSVAAGAGAQFVWNEATHTLSYDHDGAGGDAAIAIALFTNGAHIDASDLVFA